MRLTRYKSFESSLYLYDTEGNYCDEREKDIGKSIRAWLGVHSVHVIDIRYYEARSLNEHTGKQELFSGAHILYEEII